MSEPKIGDNLQKLLKLHGDLSLSELARETQIPQPTLHHIIEGKTKKPRRQALQALADFFSISIPQLTGTIPFSLVIPDTIKDSLQISTVPLINWEDAKNWKFDRNDLSKYEEIILKRKIDKNAFALQLTDTNLEPLFQEKSILIFDPSKDAKERDFVLVYLSKYNILIFNRLFVDGKNFYIKQDRKDEDADLIKIDFKKDRILAVLVEARLQF